MIVAVTGSIGAGKSTVARFFKGAGFRVIDVDGLGHELLLDDVARRQLINCFGKVICDNEGNIDRARLAGLAFSHKDRLKSLNDITCPHLGKLLRSRLRELSGDVVIDAALCKELGIPSLADRIILVTSDTAMIFERLTNRYTKEQIENIMSSQSPVEEPDYVLENNSTKQDLKKKVVELCKRLK
jgi:dephospho-CoA kinase